MKTAASTGWPAPRSRKVDRFRARASAAIILFLPGFLCLFSAAQNSRPTESQVKSAYLYNFGKFVTFPADHASEQLSICILGKDPFGNILDATVSGEQINGKRIVVQRIASMQQAKPCNILFVSSSEEDNLGTILLGSERLSLLTVSDMKGFAEQGGVIGMVTHGDRVRFEVNRAAAERNHLTLSSELLEVAIRVIEQKRAGK